VTGLRFAPTKITWDFFDISSPSEMKPYICSIVRSCLRARRAEMAAVASRVEVSTTVDEGLDRGLALGPSLSHVDAVRARG
jgi:hypothetical protein